MKITTSGSLDNSVRYLRKMSGFNGSSKLNDIGQSMVDNLRGATPSKTGKTAAAWAYKSAGKNSIEVYNSNVINGFNVAIGIDNGHGTGTGGYVPPRPYIKQTVNSIWQSKKDSLLRDYR